MPYYINHIIIALIISGVAYFIPDGWIFMGGAVYLSREQAQFERNRKILREYPFLELENRFDWKGLAPIPILIIIWIFL